MSDIILTGPVLDKAKDWINRALVNAGVHTVLLIDHAGNIVVRCGHSRTDFDLTSFAALAAANFGATAQMAQLIGEDDFSLLFHKGKKDSIHFAKVGNDMILISIFGDDVSLGLVRLRVAELTRNMAKLFGLDKINGTY